MSHFGRFFRVSTFGESHCKAVGCIVDGVPPQMELSEADIQTQLTRRRPGQSDLTTPRNEADAVSIMSGCERGYTLGTPICMIVHNNDQRPGDYKEMSDVPRPSHADFTYQEKYGIRATSGGGRSSARETIGRVAAAGIAEKWLKLMYGIEIVAYVSAVGPIKMNESDETFKNITRADVDKTMLRCPDATVTEEMSTLIRKCADEHDSVGGVVSCVVRGVPTGWGEPCFDKLEALLAHAMLSIPATKGFEIGSGFEGAKQNGSVHNDPFVKLGNGKVGTSTNNSGGVQGGISNGMPINVRVAFKPPATISREQTTCTFDGTDSSLAAKGRHDPCVVPRAVPIVEAMAALVLADVAMSQLARHAGLVPPSSLPTTSNAEGPAVGQHYCKKRKIENPAEPEH
ncbi:chorismate synthase [Sphaeroforma arctica JP610]|uniref:Chorismate synthase n=1 Tax=Sphaeroforma arctica JP610 TaxID=667725 RepID=A0A0L0G9I9_9EUKA|nr:chorismate synthase [Sphaeroforma arctica JP610]KNC85551.1 chorismate synthase [Sphaeroforma arctica JP610]|eukprot:XP_014159453.1 chorismate synthase [Sphaeroforma arctica JP610]